MPELLHHHASRSLLWGALAGLALISNTAALAQQVQDIQPAGNQPPMITLPASGTSKAAEPAGNASPMVADIDLGQTPGGSRSLPSTSDTAAPKPQGIARRAAAAAQGTPETTTASPTPAALTGKGRGRAAMRPAGARESTDRPGIERAVFARLPVRVGLPVLRERLITLPGPAALHVPADIETVARIETIDRTIYVTALVPFAPIRIVAELIEGGQQIPLDLVANTQTGAASAELEVFLDKSPPRSAASPSQGSPNEGPPAADMVELTRYASRMLYAPRRLATARTGIQQVQVSTKPVAGLVRGGLVEAVPLGQWRSAGLYVTAVRVTNKASQPFELPLEHLRGRWIAVTAQHGRIGPAGSETDTTALYLVCDRAFDACL